MTRIALFITMLLFYPALCMEGPDFMLLGINRTPSPGFFNTCGAELDDDGINVSLQNAHLYNISSLEWNYVGVNYTSGCWTLDGAFRMYGVNDIYESNCYSAGIHYLFMDRYSIGAGYQRKSVNYGSGLYKSGFDNISFSCGYKYNDYSLHFNVSNIALNDNDNALGDPEYLLSGTWQVYRELSVFSAFYKNSYDHDRFLFGQNLTLNEHLNVNAGFISGPEVYFVGFEIVYKGLVFGYTYYDLADLPNSSKITLSYR